MTERRVTGVVVKAERYIVIQGCSWKVFEGGDYLRGDTKLSNFVFTGRWRCKLCL
jgi:hypothetical protein